ncbi:MAG: DUF373 family protein [Acidilobaceae archaeon]|nr:DUF373 family protein [Acidilobaceae archaeon]MCX8165082.1 DUF373 family protein [Acidilobaceae archaeon]MDW7974401.1 DUF373 family protein [Sulfolobales archaeon]
MNLKPLVIVVDLDDDISEVIGQSLAVGEEMVLDVALSYAMERPEDADLNAIFTGLSLYRKLKSKGLEPEIAIVGGSKRDEVDAQIKVRERVRKVLEEMEGKRELYIVGDGLDEVLVAEVLGDLAPVAAVKRVIVEQQESIETSYALIARYARKALTDPRFSKYTLGIPGIMIFVLAAFSMFGLLLEAVTFMLLILGVAMTIKGFALEKPIASLAGRILENIRETPHIKLAGMILMLALTASGVSAAYHAYVTEGFYEAVARSLTTSIPLMLIGVVMYVAVAHALESMISWSFRVFKHLAIISVFLASALAFHNLGTHFASSLTVGDIQPAEALYRATLDSNFIPIVITGTALGMLFEMIGRMKR